MSKNKMANEVMSNLPGFSKNFWGTPKFSGKTLFGQVGAQLIVGAATAVAGTLITMAVTKGQRKIAEHRANALEARNAEHEFFHKNREVDEFGAGQNAQTANAGRRARESVG